MPDRTAPYPSYNYLVDLKGPRDPAKLLGGFSDVTGLTTETHMSEYRDGNEPKAHVRKIPGSYTVGPVTLKRGVVNSADLWDWMQQTRVQGAAAKRDVTITLRDEAGNPVQVYKLFNVSPSKISGPNLVGKGGADVAMEEFVLTPEDIEITPVS
jgi:phage tail-like protein